MMHRRKASTDLNGNARARFPVAMLTALSASLAWTSTASSQVPSAHGPVVTPWQFGARGGDCRSDSSLALQRAADAAVRRGVTLWTGDGCLAIAATFIPPRGLVWRSDFLDAHRLIWKGSRHDDVIEVNSPVDMDGIVIDGGRPAGLDRMAVTLAGNDGRALLAVHGGIATGAPQVLSGVRIGRVRVENSGWSTGVLAVNVNDLQVARVETHGIWGVATMWAGVSNSHVGVVSAEDTGQLGKEGARAGQAVAIFAESDPRKRPAKFFELADPNLPARNVLPTSGLRFDRIETRANTDTAIYIHDYPGGRGGSGIGIDGVSIGSITGDLVGKDLFKVRHYAGNVTVGSITGSRIGARIVSVEDHAHDVTIGSVTGTDFGYDVIGAMMGRSARFDGQDHGQGVGFGQTLSTSAVAISILDNAHNVRIDGGSVRGVPAFWNGKNGYGLMVTDADNVKVRLAIADTAGAGLRMANTNRFDIDADISGACLRSQCDAAVVLADDGRGPVHDGRLAYTVGRSVGNGHAAMRFKAGQGLQNVTLLDRP